jgi:membrane-bound serine protease (ClpP class)
LVRYLSLLLLLLAAPLAAQVVVLDVKGPIGPATANYLEQGIKKATEQRAQLIVLQMDTPGGLDSTTRDIVHAILASPIPVATFVAPSGSRAASAGAYILYASHIAAMAPATNVGAATPVALGGAPPSPPRQPQNKDIPPADTAQNAGERKAINDSVAYIRGLAELRGRNADWAEQAVREAASLSASQALFQGVIDVMATDLPQLLDKLHGRAVKIGKGSITLQTKGLRIERLAPDWRTELLSVITNPTIAYGLLLLGIYGLLLEGYNPGAIVPGVVGAISLILALFALQVLSFNYAGLALIAVGVLMIVLEFFVASFGALGLGGLTAFVIGSIILFDRDIPGMSIALPVIGGIAVAGGAAILGTAYLATRAMRKPVATGMQSMLGDTAEVVGDFDQQGHVRYAGELWQAYTATPVRAGQTVRIKKVSGLSVWIEPC